MDKNLLYIKSFFQEKLVGMQHLSSGEIISNYQKNSFLNNIFDLVPFVIYVKELATFEMHFASKELKNLVGYSPEEFFESSADLLNYIHPNDRQKLQGAEYQLFLNQIKSMNEDQLKDARFSKNFRLKHKNGNYIQCLDQSVLLDRDDQNDRFLVVGILIDISIFKTDDEVIFTISEYTPTNDQQLISTQKIKAKTTITEREKEILKLLLNGFSSKEIAVSLKISIHTANTHRGNLLVKFKCKNTKELIHLARKEGIV
jgi:DNA-binding CsgD family transcriptional regulator